MLRAYPELKGDGPMRSLAAIAILVCAFKICDTAYSSSAVMLFGLFFVFVTTGASLFGLLELRGTRRMGNISYSVYMLHLIILSVVMAPSVLGRYAASTPSHFWIVAALVFAVVIGAALLSYTVVEQGGVKLGKNIMRRRRVGMSPDAA